MKVVFGLSIIYFLLYWVTQDKVTESVLILYVFDGKSSCFVTAFLSCRTVRISRVSVARLNIFYGGIR